MIELTEIMRQKDGQSFTGLLNRFKTASQTEEDIKVIQSEASFSTDVNYPSHALHIFAENARVNQRNNAHLDNLTTPLHRLEAVDQYPPNVTKQVIDRVLARGRLETGGLDSQVLIKLILG